MPRFNHKLASLFSNPHSAAAVHDRLVDAGYPPQQLALIRPGDPDLERKIEPEARQVVGDALLRIGLGALTGALLGMLIAGLALHGATDRLAWSLFLGALYGASILGLVGGLLALRPREVRFASTIKDRTATGEHAVVVHTANRCQFRLARAQLQALPHRALLRC